MPINLKLVKLYQDWYNSLTLSPWNKDKNSDFWNEPLHKQQQPQDGNYLLPNLDKKIAHEVKGSDYK